MSTVQYSSYCNSRSFSYSTKGGFVILPFVSQLLLQARGDRSWKLEAVRENKSPSPGTEHHSHAKSLSLILALILALSLSVSLILSPWSNNSLLSSAVS